MVLFVVVSASGNTGSSQFTYTCLSNSRVASTVHLIDSESTVKAVEEPLIDMRLTFLEPPHIITCKTAEHHVKLELGVVDSKTGNFVASGTDECSLSIRLESCSEHKKEHLFDLEEGKCENVTHYRITSSSLASASDEEELCFQILITPQTFLARYRIPVAIALLVVMFACLAFEVADRTILVMFGSFVIILFVTLLEGVPTMEVMLAGVDFDTLLLLLGMMIMVNIIQVTGCFEIAGVKALRLAKGNPVVIMITFSVLTGVLSAFLDNVSTILLLAPLIIQISSLMDIQHSHLLLACVFASNIEGALTVIGDPPVLLVYSAFSPRFSFVDIIKGMFGPTTISLALSIGYCLVVFRKTFFVSKSKRESIASLDFEYLEDVYKLKNPALFRKSVIILSLVVIGFFTHSLTHIAPAMCAIFGASILLMLSDRHDAIEYIEKVEWGTLMFFFFLFVFLSFVEYLGVISMIAESLGDIIAGVSPANQNLVAIQIVIWTSAVASAFIDNIPVTISLIPIVEFLGSNADLNVNSNGLVFALIVGACFGGNGSAIGSSASLISMSLSEKYVKSVSEATSDVGDLRDFDTKVKFNKQKDKKGGHTLLLSTHPVPQFIGGTSASQSRRTSFSEDPPSFGEGRIEDLAVGDAQISMDEDQSLEIEVPMEDEQVLGWEIHGEEKDSEATEDEEEFLSAGSSAQSGSSDISSSISDSCTHSSYSALSGISESTDHSTSRAAEHGSAEVTPSASSSRVGLRAPTDIDLGAMSVPPDRAKQAAETARMRHKQLGADKKAPTTRKGELKQKLNPQEEAISFKNFLLTGFPVMIITCAASSIILSLAYRA